MKECVLKISEKLGGDNAKLCLQYLDEGKLADVARRSLQYYDKAYAHLYNNKKQNIIVVASDTIDPAINALKESLDNNIKSIERINPLIPLSEQSLYELNNISNLIKSVPELATEALNAKIANIVHQQIESMTSGLFPFQDYIFSMADASLEIKNAL